MLERGDPNRRSFGMRRAEDRPERDGPETRAGTRDGFEIPDWDRPARPAGPLAWALRTAALAGLVAIFATQYLVRLSGPGDPAITRVAQGGRGLADPETTGSIGRPGPASPAGAARATRLDPCAVAGGAPLRP